MKSFLIAVFLLAASVQGEEVANGTITKVPKGGTAPYDGFLVDKSQMEYFRQINEERKLLEHKVIKLEELGKITIDNLDWYKASYFDLKKEHETQQTKTFWTNTLYFFGGILITGAISYATIKTIR